mgnify:CR=1 FL=1|jgi:hypothetical protein|tara:strand:- start:1805 stop:2350 length:546 start_codon:yes stop_codon:yes gene_type:complete
MDISETIQKVNTYPHRKAIARTCRARKHGNKAKRRKTPLGAGQKSYGISEYGGFSAEVAVGQYLSLYRQLFEKFTKPLLPDRYDYLYHDRPLEVKSTLRRDAPLCIYDEKKAQYYVLVWPTGTVHRWDIVGYLTHKQMQDRGRWREGVRNGRKWKRFEVAAGDLEDIKELLPEDRIMRFGT